MLPVGGALSVAAASAAPTCCRRGAPPGDPTALFTNSSRNHRAPSLSHTHTQTHARHTRALLSPLDPNPRARAQGSKQRPCLCWCLQGERGLPLPGAPLFSLSLFHHPDGGSLGSAQGRRARGTRRGEPALAVLAPADRALLLLLLRHSDQLQEGTRTSRTRRSSVARLDRRGILARAPHAAARRRRGLAAGLGRCSRPLQPRRARGRLPAGVRRGAAVWPRRRRGRRPRREPADLRQGHREDSRE